MHKVGLFREYNKEDIKSFDHVLCFKSKSKAKVFEYSSNRATFCRYEGYTVLLSAKAGEPELTIVSMKLDKEKTLVYFYGNDKKYIEFLRKNYPKLKVINSENNPKLSLEITKEGFKWKKYDNISLPKPNKDPERNKPIVG